MIVPEIQLFGFFLSPVATILIAEAFLFFLLMNIDKLIGKVFTFGNSKIFSKWFYFWVFMMFALLSAAPAIFGLETQDMALILGTVILFGAFVPSFGVRNIRQNFAVLSVAIVGSFVGYNVARLLINL